MANVIVHEFKRMDLKGGTLIVSIPNVGIGNVLLTDFLLERHRMDQIAAFDSDDFPPVAMLHAGRARFPVRIHADPERRVAVLRSEFPMQPPVMRPLSDAILSWAKSQQIKWVVALDSLWMPDDAESADSLGGLQALGMGNGSENGHGATGAQTAQTSTGGLVFSTLQESARVEADGIGLQPFNEGALAGVPAMLVLHSRLQQMPVLALLALVGSPQEDLHSATTFADWLPRLINGLSVDRQALDQELGNIDEAVRGVQAQARAIVRELQRQGDGDGTDSETPSMYM